MGIATAMAVDQLSDRLLRIDQKMDRIESSLRRLARRQMALESKGTSTVSTVKKKSPKPKKASKLSKKAAQPQNPEPVKKEAADNVTKLERVIPLELKGESSKELDLPVVLLIQPDAETHKVVRDYFGKGVEVISLDGVEEISEIEGEREVRAILFERTLLGDPRVKNTLEALKSELPRTRFLGLSNYVTLALARSVPGTEDFATFLTRPITADNLNDVFGEKGQEAIS